MTAKWLSPLLREKNNQQSQSVREDEQTMERMESPHGVMAVVVSLQKLGSTCWWSACVGKD